MIYNFIKFGAFVAIVALFSACSRIALVTPSGATNFDGEIYQDLYNYRLQRINFGFGSGGSSRVLLTNDPCDVIIDHLTLMVGNRYTPYVLIATSKQCDQNTTTSISPQQNATVAKKEREFDIGETVKYSNNNGEIGVGVIEQVIDDNYVRINDGGFRVKIHKSKILTK